MKIQRCMAFGTLAFALSLSLDLAVARAADSAPAAVSGTVFLDANANAKRDAGEKGVAGVRVTDGMGFALTDAEGAYSLAIADDYIIPYRPARTVSVCWPTGTWPAGRWWHRLSEIADAKAVDFALREDRQALPFVFLQTSDDHGSGKMYSEHYARDARAMAPLAKFLFNTGDMGYATPDGAEAMFLSIAGHAAAFPLPMFITPGNHDFVGENDKVRMDSHPLAGWGAQTKFLGPVRWSFDYAGVHFLGLDYMEKTEKGYEDRVPRVAVQFMEKDLAQVPEGTRVVLLVHCYDAVPEFFQALHKFKVELICSGHTHTPTYARVGRVPTITNYGVGTGIVTSNAIDFAERRPLTLGSGLLLGYFNSVTRPAMEKRRQKQHSVADRSVGSGRVEIAGGAEVESVEIVADLVPGSAAKFGFRSGEKSAIEIAFDGQAVWVAGAPVPFSLAALPSAAPEKLVHWHILIDRDRLTICGNDLFRLTKAVQVDRPAKVTLFAEGGEAVFRKFDLWELQPIRNPASRGLHHFAPPAWSWGTSQHVAACLDDQSATAAEILKRYSEDGVIDYDIR